MVKAERGTEAWATLMGLVLAILLGACARTPPEERLRETIATAQAAMEKKDASALQHVLAEDFIGPDGLDKDGARRMAGGLFLRYRDIGVNVGPLDIQMRGEYATVRFTAALTGGAGLLPESGQVHDVETGWRLQDGEWRLVNARWRPRL